MPEFGATRLRFTTWTLVLSTMLLGIQQVPLACAGNAAGNAACCCVAVESMPACCSEADGEDPTNQPEAPDCWCNLDPAGVLPTTAALSAPHERDTRTMLSTAVVLRSAAIDDCRIDDGRTYVIAADTYGQTVPVYLLDCAYLL